MSTCSEFRIEWETPRNISSNTSLQSSNQGPILLIEERMASITVSVVLQLGYYWQLPTQVFWVSKDYKHLRICWQRKELCKDNKVPSKCCWWCITCERFKHGSDNIGMLYVGFAVLLVQIFCWKISTGAEAQALLTASFSKLILSSSVWFSWSKLSYTTLVLVLSKNSSFLCNESDLFCSCKVLLVKDRSSISCECL